MATNLYFPIKQEGGTKQGYIAIEVSGFYLKSLLPNDAFVVINQLHYTDIYFETLDQNSKTVVFRVHLGDDCIVLTNNVDISVYSFSPEEVISKEIVRGKKFSYGSRETGEVTKIQCISCRTKYPLSRFNGLAEAILPDKFQTRTREVVFVPELSPFKNISLPVVD